MSTETIQSIAVIAVVAGAVLYLARNAWSKVFRWKRGAAPKPACGADCCDRP